MCFEDSDRQLYVQYVHTPHGASTCMQHTNVISYVFRKILSSLPVLSLLDSVTSRARVRKKLERRNHRSFGLRETKKTSIGENWSMSVCIFSCGKRAKNDVKTRRNATLPVVISSLQRAVARWYIGQPSLSFTGRISRAVPRSDSDLNDETCTTWDSVFSLAKTSKKHQVAHRRMCKHYEFQSSYE